MHLHPPHAHAPHDHMHSGPLVSCASDQTSCLPRDHYLLSSCFTHATQYIRGVQEFRSLHFRFSSLITLTPIYMYSL
jgi:hypothetical protein